MNQLIRTYFSTGLSKTEILTFLKLRDGVSISESKLKRRLKILNLYRRKNYVDIETLLTFINNEICKSGQLRGYKWMHLKCLQAGLVVTQESVRLALNILDPQGIQIRRRNRLRRRQYFNKGPNFLWHMDSYDKLKPYGIAINGCIDGFSRHIMWLKASFTNSDPKVISGYFMEVVHHLQGCPKMLRADMGTENRHVEQMHMYFSERNIFDHIIFIYGRSTANQRIESWWSILRKHSIQFWMNLFETIKDVGHFDGSFLDKSLVQFVFLDMIQHDLDVICLEWNTHRISGSRNSISPKGRPVAMFELPELYETRDYKVLLRTEDIINCEEECEIPRYPCDVDIYHLCKIILEERNLSIPEDPFDAIEIYILLRNEIRRLL